MAFKMITQLSSSVDNTTVYCDICKVFVEEKVKKELPSNFYFPGSQGCPQLNNNLTVYFVARKLLKLSDTQSLEVISSEDKEDGFQGRFCEACQVGIYEAVDIHGKMGELQRRMDLLGKKLMEGWREGRRKITKGLFTAGENEKHRSQLPLEGTRTRRSTKSAKYFNENEESSDADYAPDNWEDSADEDFSEDNLLEETQDPLELFPEVKEDDSTTEEMEGLKTVVNNEGGDLSALSITSRIPTATSDASNPPPRFRFQCTVCSKVCTARSGLHMHTKQVHGFETTYPCPICPHLQFSRSGLREHRKKVHDSAIHKCPKCDKILCTRRTLLQHFRLVHKMKVSFPCTLCSKSFKKLSELTTHKNKEHVIPGKILTKLPDREPETEMEKLWISNPCQFCGKMFLNGTTFLNHLVQTHEWKLSKEERAARGKIKCYFCWRSFLFEQTRWVHLKLDHPDIPLEFPCSSCSGISFPSVSELEDHLEGHGDGGDDTSIYKCDKCKWPFTTEEELNAHLKQHFHPTRLPEEIASRKASYSFKCWFCWEVFPTEEERHLHLEKSRRHRQLKVEFPCDLDSCPNNKQPFKTVRDLNTHLFKCHDVDPSTNQCSECGWTFADKNLLKIHKLNHAQRRYGNYKCLECDGNFRFLGRLKDHYNTCHGVNLELHKCLHCTQGFAKKLGLAKHMEAMHKEKTLEGPSPSGYPCDQCGKLFKSESAVTLHQNRLHNPLTCKDCNLDFPSNHKLQQHRHRLHSKKVSGEPHLCPECGKICEDKFALKKHRIYHGEKKVECHLCGHLTWTPATLRAHLRIHEKNAKKEPAPPPKFPCEKCDKGFSRKDSLEDHFRVAHTVEEKGVWSCVKCGKRFKRMGELEGHRRGKGCSGKWN